MAKGKKNQCDKGKPCGMTCIPRSKICRVDTVSVISKYLTFLSRKVNKVPKKFKISKKNPKVLSPLTNSDQLLKKVDDTDGFYSPKIKQLHLHIGKVLGAGSWFKRNNEEVYGSKEEEEKFKAIRKRIEDRIGAEKFADGVRALVRYTKEDYKEMRDAQRGIFTKDTIKRKAELLKLAADLERLLAQPELIKPEIEKYRGYKASPSQLKEMIDRVKAQSVLDASALSSWSSSLGQARKFSNLHINDPTKTERIILRTINRMGVPVESVTGSPKEYELLTTKNVSHRYLGYKEIHSKGVTYHVFDLEELPKAPPKA